MSGKERRSERLRVEKIGALAGSENRRDRRLKGRSRKRRIGWIDIGLPDMGRINMGLMDMEVMGMGPMDMGMMVMGLMDMGLMNTGLMDMGLVDIRMT